MLRDCSYIVIASKAHEPAQPAPVHGGIASVLGNVSAYCTVLLVSRKQYAVKDI